MWAIFSVLGVTLVDLLHFWWKCRKIGKIEKLEFFSILWLLILIPFYLSVCNDLSDCTGNAASCTSNQCVCQAGNVLDMDGGTNCIGKLQYLPLKCKYYWILNQISEISYLLACVSTSSKETLSCKQTKKLEADKNMTFSDFLGNFGGQIST